MKEIIEKTGYSYSGISNLLRDEPDKTNKILVAVDNEYTAMNNIIAKKEKELETLKHRRALLVSFFIHSHTTLSRDGKVKENEPLTFLNKMKVVVIKRVAENTIDYESIPLTPIKK